MTFMAAPGVSRTIPPRARLFDQPEREPTLALPLADRAGCERERPGTAVLPQTEDGLNGAGTMHGGLLALAVEEAVLSLAPGETLSALALRYLAPVRVGPAVARATLQGGIGRVEVRDGGREDRLAVMASARLTSAS
jgi:acyl-coenzyme A thioesterase PaaI-like protein